MAIYTELPWATIRREWETTAVGSKALARQHGIQSTTTLKRRRADEGWVKNPDATAQPAPALTPGEL